MRTPDRQITTALPIPRARRRAGGWAAAATCALLLAGCATGSPGASPAPGADGSPTPSATLPAYDVEPGETLRCGELVFPSDALVKPVVLAHADESIRNAVASAEDDAGMPAAADAPEEWIVAAADDRQIALLRPRSDDAVTSPFEQMTLVWHEAGSDRPAAWTVAAAGPCTPRADAGELNAAALALDPDQPAEPSDTTVHLLVTELACHGGEDAEGRVEVASLVETDEAVEIVVGVLPDESADAWTCQSNPPTPFALELDAPLGDREIVDVGVVPAQTLAPSEPAL